MMHERAPCELKVPAQGRQFLSATKDLSVVMLNNDLSLSSALPKHFILSPFIIYRQLLGGVFFFKDLIN